MPDPTVARLAPLVRVTRGDALDAVHWGVAVVVDREGRILASAGEADWTVATRSALKPLQALPFAASTGVDRFGFDARHLALMCASHSGEPRHVEIVNDILSRIGCTAEHLQCGNHVPMYFDVHDTSPPAPPYSPLAHNCSGKHAGMLAWCVHHGAPLADYLEPEHPLQQAIRAAVSTFADVPAASFRRGTDGCSAPNYAIPLSALARAYARLGDDSSDARYGDAPSRLAHAMRTLPELVSGDGRHDLALARAGRGDWIAKVGAEGLQALSLCRQGLGVVVKVADGHRRALMPAVVSVLEQLGVLDPDQRALLAPWRATEVRNHRGIVTGRIEPVVALSRSGPTLR